MQQRPPQIFISHSSTDIDISLRLTTDLENAGARVWIDNNDIEQGPFLPKIAQGIVSSDWFVLMLSPSSLISDYVKLEMHAAIVLSLSGKIKGLIPIKVKPCESPKLLQEFHHYDATFDYSYVYNRLCKMMGLEERKALEILIIDNDSQYLELLKSSIRKIADFPVDIFMVDNTIDGLDLVVDKVVDCVIVNSNMPQMDGHQFYRVLRGDPYTSNIPIIMVTSNAEEARRLEILETEFREIVKDSLGKVINVATDAFLMKPIDSRVLVEIIKDVVRKRKNIKSR